MEGFIKIYKLYGLYKFSTDLIEHFFYPFPSFNIVRIRCRRFNCVVWGLLLFGKSLDFFAILGLLGLIGMNIKNAIVLVDEIGLQLKDGKGAVPAVVEATKTRIVPVTMASGTTILGMLPLLGDAMFAGMAATIMGGLFVSTVLTIFVLPVTYCIFFKIRADR